MEEALREGVDLPIAVAVGFFGLYKTFKGKNPTAKANASASPDSTPSLRCCPPQSHSFPKWCGAWEGQKLKSSKAQKLKSSKAQKLKSSKAQKLIYLKEQRI
ncbi:hypothetical protein J2T18_004272 [Paenibacillus polymyxa]|uniref:hypothetical protein n=1 Tax=Paenibacillus polymyxa TaxID=1406 RepID=UPI002793886C|nr:hypothetical protein [Paenibacillus polymyxa]MDQ0049950.1 hypothetical protein [Paenibacillus polymyxa]